MLAASPQALWYVTRATGLVSLVLLTGSVVLGIIGVQRWSTRRWPRLVTGGLHKNISLLAVAFIAVHVVTAVTDTYVTITWLNVFVPFTGTYRPVWLGLGAVAGDLLIALTITSVARRFIGYRVWRAVHWAAYACWPVALVHGLGTGTDPRHGWALVVFLGSLAAVCGAVWWRLATGDGQAVTRRIPAVAASVAVPLVVLGWLAAGPLRSGWSARAGTPTPSGAVTSVSPSSLAALSAPFSATLSGTASQTAPDSAGDATVTMSATLSGPVSAVLGVRLTGHALSTGGVSLTSSSASLGTAAQPTLDVGQVTSLSGDRLKLVLSGATKAIYASVNVTIDGTGNLSGAIQTSTTPA